MEKQGSIHARYSLGRCHHHTHRTLKLPDIPIFQTTALHVLHIPEMQKAAGGGLINEITVRPTAALEIQCNSNLVSDYSATGNRTPV